MQIAMTLAGGSTEFAVFLIVFLSAVVYGLYTRQGSGIDQHPYHDQYGNAPGANGSSRMSRRIGSELQDWTRGTR